MITGFLTKVALGLAFTTLFATLPHTSSYQLNNYGFGSGGTTSAHTATYSLEGISGEVSGNAVNTATYKTNPGYIQAQQANVPKVTLSNPSSYYDKLLFVIDAQNNPSDALFALQVKVGDVTCDFTSGTINYVKLDHTLGATLVAADYNTYSYWGSGGGSNIIGLPSNTTYCIRAKATQGLFTESGYGPSSASAATVGQQLSFCLYSNANCAAAGNAEAFGTLTPTVVANSPTNIGVDFATNADSGGNIYIYSANGGLKSSAAGYTITSATADLSAVAEGYGAQIASATQATGGPFNKVSPYNGASNNVGILSTNVTNILTSANPLTGGTAAIQLKAKSTGTTPTATDYADTITVIAAGIF